MDDASASMTGEANELAAIERRYRRFATAEARGVSPLYEQLALTVAETPSLLAFLQALPDERRQPNLFLAAIREAAGMPASVSSLDVTVRTHAARIRDVMLTRTTQTNEPARCAVLLPVLAALKQPLALIEVGASAGLCLLPDKYGYDYGRHRIQPSSATAPIFPCEANSATPMPYKLPSIAWRCGLDLNPLNVTSKVDMAWLETLVWPGQEQRAQRLKAAIAVARQDPPQLRRGSLLTDLDAILTEAPRDTQPVVFHTAVLAYVSAQADRDAFARTMLQSDAVWISNEAPSVFPQFARTAPPAPGARHFLLSVNGKPVAWTDPHGRSIDWFAA
jgi:hypothetical protein